MARVLPLHFIGEGQNSGNNEETSACMAIATGKTFVSIAMQTAVAFFYNKRSEIVP